MIDAFAMAPRLPRLLLGSLTFFLGCAQPVPPRAEVPSPSARPSSHADAHAHAHHGHHPHNVHGMPHRFEDAAAWSREFDAAERDAWQKPNEVVSALGLPPTARVADVGAGTGYFAMRLARAVPEGRVVALDVEPDMVRFMTERAAREGLSNLEARQTPGDRAALDPDTDLVLVVDTYHHLGDRVAYFKALAPSLGPHGRVAVIDFRQESAKGPPKAYKLPPEVVGRELGEAGFEEVGRFEFLPEQYFLVFSPRR